MNIPDGYAQANIIYAGSPVPTGAENTWGVKLDDPAATPISVGTAFLAQIDASGVMASFSEDISIVSCRVKFGPNATGPANEVFQTISGEGDQAVVPPNLSVLMRKNTSSGGRAGSGRVYLPGIEEISVDGSGFLDGGVKSGIEDKWEDIRAGMALADLPLVVLHGADSPLATPSLITSLVVDSKAATQRRRLRR